MFDKKSFIELLDKIDLYDDAYYNEDKKLVSDQEYDGLKDKLFNSGKLFLDTLNEEKSSKDIKLSIRYNDVITRVGAPPPKDGKWPKIQHEVPMGSLNKVNIPQELEKWNNKCNNTNILFITEKLDGASVSLKYENGIFVQALSRGDGLVGEYITRNVRRMKFVPLKLSDNFTGHIRGEIVLLHSDWKTYLPDMANPRNGASGVAKRIDGQDVQHLSVITYTVEGKNFNTEVESFEYIKSLGFKTPNYSVGTIDYAINVWQKYMSETREKLDYDIDGLVIRINDISKQLSLGEENHRPKGAIAFKFEAPEARTIINNIVCQIGDTGGF